jgi:endo-1,4-beta-xylanase
MTRLSLVLLPAALAAFAGPGVASGAAAPAREPPGLRELAAARGLHLGAAVAPGHLQDKELAEALVRNFDYLTPDNSLKWEAVHPAPGQYRFDDADAIVAFAQAHGMAVRGHNLAWHIQNPAWLLGSSELRDDPQALLREHITQVVGHFKGKIRDWDVVNEPLDENGELRKNLWLVAIGPDYIERAFRWAHEADPQAKLFLNEYGNETPGPKSDAFQKLVKDLLARGVPIHGVGLQFHLEGRYVPDFGAVAKNLERLAALGVEVQITELDVRLEQPAGPEALAQQAQIYAELTRAALAYKASALITWGMTDRFSWIPGHFRGQGSALLFDEQLRPKPAAAAVRDVLAGPPPDPAYFTKYTTGIARSSPPLRATMARVPPVLDGVANDAAWKDAYVYSLAFNQLAGGNMAPPLSQKDVHGTLRLVFRGTRLYGLLTRVDDVTVTVHKDPWENDNFELFYRLDGAWRQIRTIVGQDWQKDHRPRDGKAVWSADGSVLEFEADLGSELAGRTIGFSAALSDNDTPDRASRKCQLYPFPGNNTGWQGKGYGELTLQDATGEFTEGEAVGDPMLFTAAAGTAPAVDGDPSDAQWSLAPRYPFAYNQLSRDQSIPFTGGNTPGTFRLLAAGNTVYGLVQLAEDASARYDAVEVALALEGKTAVLTAAAGKEFAATPGAPPARAAWSKDGRTLEFQVQLSDAPLSGKRARFTLGLLGVKGADGKRLVALEPFPGYARMEQAEGQDLGALMSRKTLDMAELLLQ